MKKYIKLTSNEAIKYFIRRDGTLAPETNEEIRHKLQMLSNLKDSAGVSIIMPTHRIHPESMQDKIALKNLAVQVNNNLNGILDKKKVKAIMENIDEAQDVIDYSHNLDSLVLYANEKFSSVVKLPIELDEGILIDSHFDYRPLFKSGQQNQHYYIMTISRNIIRLFEAFNDKILEEIDNDDFPFENTEYYTTDPIKLKQDIFMDNLIKEYFNVADKKLHKYIMENPIPIILLGDVKSVAYFQDMMDNDHSVIAQISGNYDNAPVHEIIKIVYPVIERYRNDQNSNYIKDLNRAKSENLLSTDLNEIYEYTLGGNAETLYVGNNYSIRGNIDGNKINISNSISTGKKDEEIVLILIENVYRNNGRIIFLNDDVLKKYNGLVLVKRY